MSLLGTLGTIGGAGIGLAVSGGNPAGALAGAGIGGGLANSLSSNDYKAPTFSDIDLKNTNPELYAQLMKESAMADQAEAIYNQRRQGPTYGELQDIASARNSQYGQQANSGQLGSAVGAAQAADVEARLRGNLQAKAFQEQQQLLAQSQAARHGYLNDYSQARQNGLGQLTQAAQINYQNAQAEDQGQNQLLSGLVSGGLALYGQQQNIAAMQGLNASNPYATSQNNFFTGTNPYAQGLSYQPTQPSYNLGIGR